MFFIYHAQLLEIRNSKSWHMCCINSNLLTLCFVLNEWTFLGNVLIKDENKKRAISFSKITRHEISNLFLNECIAYIAFCTMNIFDLLMDFSCSHNFLKSECLKNILIVRGESFMKKR